MTLTPVDTLEQMVVAGVDVPFDAQPSVLRFRAPVSSPRLELLSAAVSLQFWDLGRRRRLTTVVGTPSAADLTQILEEHPVLERVSGGVKPSGPGDVGTAVEFLEDRRYAEYICSLPAQIALSGREFGRRRTYLRAAERRVPRYRARHLDLFAPEDRRAVMSFAQNWIGGRDDAEMLGELECIDHSLRPASSPWLRGLIVEAEDRVVGFALWAVSGSTSVAHVVKADRDGTAAAVTWHQMFVAASRAGATRMTCGYDGGLEGLRRAKLGLSPAVVLPRYTVVPE